MSTEKINHDQNFFLDEIIGTIKANELELLEQHQLNRIKAIAGVKIQLKNRRNAAA